MTIHEAIFTPARQPLMTVFLLLLTLQIALIFASFRDGRSRRVILLYFLGFLVGFLLFYMLLLDISWKINYPDGSRAFPAVLTAFGSLSVFFLILYEILIALILLVTFRDLIRFRKNHLTFESIKETMDLLPVAVACAKQDGSVVFRNLTMNGISRALTGKELTDLAVFQKAAAPASETQLSLPDGSAVWQFAGETLIVDGEPYTQLIATDISEQTAITRELEEKNIKLRELHMRLEIYNKQADRIIIAQELLNARMAVHNEVGNVLLESRHYLKDPSSFDEEMLLQALKNTNTYLLREYEEDDTPKDSLADALETAEVIGVDVSITGLIPTEDPARIILAAAVIECASNTVKHANGDRLLVDVQSTEAELVYTLRNNGDAPKETIRESGGLLSLRSLVEKEHGTMLTAASPSFTLTIHLPNAF